MPKNNTEAAETDSASGEERDLAACPKTATTSGKAVPPPKPVEYLMNWREILTCLRMKNNEECRRRVREANERYEGPIILPRAGGQPKVNKDKLLPWWNGLEERFREIEQKRSDAEATVDDQYSYGRNETVVPEIEGHVKKRRKKPNQ
jgi:hypothetical protein